ncbi:hypothetical protein A1D22_10935 [Pasteurellaceae bacterium LFhippo2]|nr:hypothetical protein [Pasteurellaceae bacterium LFhippo2]
MGYLFMSKLTDEEKKAKNREYQRKYRQKAKSRLELDEKIGKAKETKQKIKRVDVYLNVETQSNLAYLASSSGKTKKEVLEMLINAEYDRLQNS